MFQEQRDQGRHCPGARVLWHVHSWVFWCEDSTQGGLNAVKWKKVDSQKVVDIRSHVSDSLLGMIQLATSARMLIFWACLSRIASPRERRPK